MSSISGRNLKIAGLVWGISLTVFALVYLFVLKPQKAELVRLQTELYQKFPGNAADEVNIQKMKEEAEDMEAQLSAFVVPSSSYIQTLATTELLNIAKAQKLDSFLIKPWSGDEVSAFKDCKYVYGQFLKVSFNSTYNDFAKFLNILEMYKSVIFVESFSITRSKDEDTEPGIKHKVEMNLSVLVEKQTAGGRQS